MYIDAEKSRERIAEEAFKEGMVIATYALDTHQCTSLAVINFDLTTDSVVTPENIELPAPKEGEGICVIENLKTNTAADNENMVDPKTKTLVRKPKFRIKMREDKDYNSVAQTIKVREEPYTIDVDMVDCDDNVIEDPKEDVTLKLKDRDKLCAISSPTIQYPSTKTFQIKARSSGVSCCIRVKDDKYQYVPGLMSLEVRPPEF